MHYAKLPEVVMYVALVVFVELPSFQDLDVLIAEEAAEPLDSIRRRLGPPNRLTEDEVLSLLLAPDSTNTRDAA